MPAKRRSSKKKDQYVHALHFERTMGAFAQYLDLTITELNQKLRPRNPGHLSRMRVGQRVCSEEDALELFRELGFLIDEYVDEENDIPPTLKKEVVEYLDSLIQPFGPKSK